LSFLQRTWIAALLATVGGLHWQEAQAGVVVLTNRSDAPVEFKIAGRAGAATESYRLAPGETIPIHSRQDLQLACELGGRAQQYLLQLDSIYFFAKGKEGIAFSQLGLNAPPAADQPSPENRAQMVPPAGRPSDVIPVKILVDDDEPAVERIWKQRIGQRLAEASAIFDRLCGIRFEMVAEETWNSDGAVNDFGRSLAEFEAEVKPAPGVLAIGFTSQYPADRFSHDLGGTRGPLYPYILIREWSQEIQETERLEILVHELGHYLGAAHSADANSAMRPKMTDRRARARDFQVTFDPLNTLVVCLVAEEIRTRGARNLLEVSPATRAKLRGAYAAMAAALPDDKSTARYVAALDKLAGIEARVAQHTEPLAAGTRTVLEAVVAAARENDVLRRRVQAGRVRDAAPLDGDRLIEHLVRRAASAAQELAPEVGPQAFLLGLGIALDDTSLLQNNPVLGRLGPRVETDDEREERLSVLGTPTMHGRRDLAQHFVISATLAVLAGPQAAETIGVLKEIRDSQRGSGFSFVDLAADLSGVAFAERVRQDAKILPKLAASFAVADFLPNGGGLREGIAWKAFVEAYGSPQDDRFLREVAALRARISELPGFRRE